MKKKQKRNPKIITEKTIIKATKGDIIELEKILNYFKGYMITLSTRILIDEYGNTYSFFDETIYERLEMKLIKAIVTKFNVDFFNVE